MKYRFRERNLVVFWILLALLGWQCASDSTEQVAEKEAVEEVNNAFKLANGKTENDTLADVKNLKIRRGPNKERIFYRGDSLFNGTAVQGSKGNTGYMEYAIKDGLQVMTRGYFQNGQLERSFSFKDGKAHGKLELYYQNGQKQVEEYYNNGELDGRQQRWYENGQLMQEKLYENGEMVEKKLYTETG